MQKAGMRGMHVLHFAVIGLLLAVASWLGTHVYNEILRAIEFFGKGQQL
jgi:hypothetical protein